MTPQTRAPERHDDSHRHRDGSLPSLPTRSSRGRLWHGATTAALGVHTIVSIAYWIAGAMLIVGVWWAWIRVDHTPAYLLPRPEDVAARSIGAREKFLDATWSTFETTMLGLIVGLAVGVAAALLIDMARVVERALYPALLVFRGVVVGIAPLIVLVMGYGLSARVTVTALITFFPIVVATLFGLRVRRETIRLAQSMGAGRASILLHIKLPHALPSIFAGTRIAATFAVIGAILAEFLGSSAGLGYMITAAGIQFETVDMFAAFVYVSVLGFGLYGSVGVLERWVVPWHVERQQQAAVSSGRQIERPG